MVEADETLSQPIGHRHRVVEMSHGENELHGRTQVRRGDRGCAGSRVAESSSGSLFRDFQSATCETAASARKEAAKPESPHLNGSRAIAIPGHDRRPRELAEHDRQRHDSRSLAPVIRRRAKIASL